MMPKLLNVPVNKRYNCVFGQYSNALKVEILGRDVGGFVFRGWSRRYVKYH